MIADVWLTLDDGRVFEVGGVHYHPRHHVERADVRTAADFQAGRSRMVNCLRLASPLIRCEELPEGLVREFETRGLFRAQLIASVAEIVVFRGRVVVTALWTDAGPIPCGIDMASLGVFEIAEAHKTLAPWGWPTPSSAQV